MVVCIVAATQAFAAHFNQCDNIAGTCIRSRQLAAIMSLQLACAAGAALALGLAYAVARGRRVRAFISVPTLVGSAAVALFVLTADPISHLNNSFDGWLS